MNGALAFHLLPASKTILVTEKDARDGKVTLLKYSEKESNQVIWTAEWAGHIPYLMAAEDECVAILWRSRKDWEFLFIFVYNLMNGQLKATIKLFYYFTQCLQCS